MIRVTHLLTSTAPGGAERLAVHLLRHLDRTRFAPSVLLLYGPSGSDLDTLLADADIPVHALGKRGPGPRPAVAARAWGAVSRLRPHVVHTHGYALAYVLPALWGLRVPAAVHTVHTEADRETLRAGGRLLHRVAFSTGVQPVFASASIRASFERLYPQRHGVVIENGIPLGAHGTADGAAWRSAEGFTARDRIALFVGRLEPVKRPAALVEAFAEVARRLPDAKLVLLGEGSERGAVERAVDAAGLAERVRLLGFCDDVPSALAGADVMVLNSAYEGLPLAVIEAMAAGVPIVAPRVGALPEVVGANDAGLLFAPGDAIGLAEALAALLDDATARARQGAAGRRVATERFSIDAAARRYEALYERLLQR